MVNFLSCGVDAPKEKADANFVITDSQGKMSWDIASANLRLRKKTDGLEIMSPHYGPWL